MAERPDDLYTILGVAQDASTDEIKKAFRSLARTCHPDVAGSAPEVAERFKRIREAYDVLSDPVARGRYDRRRQPRKAAPRMPGGFYFWGDGFPGQGSPPPQPGAAGKDSGNDLDLEDLFGDHGGFADFGMGSARQNRGSRARSSGTAEPVPGRDIAMTVDVPSDVAGAGGTVTLNYVRQRRGDDGVSVFRYDELYDLRVPPGTRHGDTLREQGWGHAGPNGGPYGDLVCDVRVVGPQPRPTGRVNLRGQPAPAPQERAAERGPERGPERPNGQATPPRPEPPNPGTEPTVVPISVVEALLGGRIELDTPQGRVVLNLPSCTSGGARFRLRGKGPTGPGGQASDLVVQLRVVCPPILDAESEELIRRFADLNPYNPRTGGA